MFISITRPGRARKPLLTVKTDEPVKTAKDALRVVMAKVTTPRRAKEKDVALLARSLGIKSKGKK